MTDSGDQPDRSWSPGLEAGDVQTLLALVADTLAWCVCGDADPFSFEPYRPVTALDQSLGNFVTLYHAAELRGCIGTLDATEKLYVSVHENALHAARSDRRFAPIAQEELGGVTYTVSVLSAPREIASVSEFRLGVQGISLYLRDQSAVFLPSVPTEQNWDVQQTAESLCRKAGLPLDAWQDEHARFEVFESVVYASHEEGAQNA